MECERCGYDAGVVTEWTTYDGKGEPVKIMLCRVCPYIHPPYDYIALNFAICTNLILEALNE